MREISNKKRLALFFILLGVGVGLCMPLSSLHAEKLDPVDPNPPQNPPPAVPQKEPEPIEIERAVA